MGETAELDAAIFDMGGVLTTPIMPSFTRFERSLGIPEGALTGIFLEHYAVTGVEHDFHALERGEITEAEYYRRLELLLRERTGLEVSLPADPAAVRRGLLGNVRRNEEMIEAARRIAACYPTGVVTNNVREWGGWRDLYPMEIFQVVVDSCEVGVRKPDPEIFRIACERLGVAPARTAFVDDIKENADAARRLGMRAILFTETEPVLAELRALFPRAFAGTPAVEGA